MAMGVGVGVVLISPTGERMEYAIRLHFRATNNITKYEALIHSLRIASSLGACHLFIKGDSELVIN
jgi:ribonuclease HI